MQPFWNYHACRTFIEAAVQHYAGGPAWFVNWLEDVYIRLGDSDKSITLDELTTLGMLYVDDCWEHENYAVNRVYKYFNRAGRDTTGIMGY